MDQSRSIPPIPPQATPEELNRGLNTLIDDYNRSIGTNKISFSTSGGSGTLTTIKDEGATLSAVATSIDFVGAGVTATGGPAVTVTIPGGGGVGDMILASAQTNSGVKTFLDTTLALRNVANTFSSVFTNTNTAARTYTLKDATGTLAFTSDITGTNSGTNTGDQTITLTGHVTGAGTGSFATSTASKMILQGTADATTSAAQFLGALGTGIVKNTTTTGVLSIAINSDLPAMSSTVGGAVPTPPNNTTTFLRGDGTFAAPSTGAPVGASYVTLGTDATLTSERVLTGTANQVILTDGGAGSTLTLSLPQSIATSSTVQFGKIGVGQANVNAAYYEAKTLTAGGIQGMRLEADTTTNVQFSSFLTGDAQLRFSFLADGTQKWGSGSAVADTNLYRSAVNTLKTDNILLIGTPGTVALSAATIDGIQTLTNKTATSTTNNITAKGLFSLTTTVDVSGSTAPTVGQALVATSGSTATWQAITATAPDLNQDNLSPSLNQSVTAGYSSVVVRSYKIASGKKLTIGLGARFRIL